ncbi:hypothetical protein IEQ34_019956 [Dendrobium chrysotoxum]|uniref:Uncharacterized protein n=1 Tax=Dendrobium chrysotoxum TaxID=161865 RepID=A0AAV7GAU1_DENCH|nr:hypothetical protein IEQ34_019956 [Dendrobium chrysotoxum]
MKADSYCSKVLTWLIMHSYSEPLYLHHLALSAEGKSSIAVAISENRVFGPKLAEQMQYCVGHPEEIISKLTNVKAQVTKVNSHDGKYRGFVYFWVIWPFRAVVEGLHSCLWLFGYFGQPFRDWHIGRRLENPTQRERKVQLGLVSIYGSDQHPEGLRNFHPLALKADGGGMDDGPDQDPMVPSSRAIVVPGLLNQRRSGGVELQLMDAFCLLVQKLQIRWRSAGISSGNLYAFCLLAWVLQIRWRIITASRLSYSMLCTGRIVIEGSKVERQQRDRRSGESARDLAAEAREREKVALTVSEIPSLLLIGREATSSEERGCTTTKEVELSSFLPI